MKKNLGREQQVDTNFEAFERRMLSAQIFSRFANYKNVRMHPRPFAIALPPSVNLLARLCVCVSPVYNCVAFLK